MSSMIVCRSCKNFDMNRCLVGQPLGPSSRDDCWRYTNKHQKYNLAENSKGNSLDRLKGTWQY